MDYLFYLHMLGKYGVNIMKNKVAEDEYQEMLGTNPRLRFETELLCKYKIKLK